MTALATKSSATTDTSEKENLKRAKFALLAMVGRHKRQASRFQEETEFYCGIVTDLLALSMEQNRLVQKLADKAPGLKAISAEHTSELHRLVYRIHGFWPSDGESQQRLLDLLASPGLEMVQGTTPDGYLSLSTDLILDNVARVIEATSEQPRKT